MRFTILLAGLLLTACADGEADTVDEASSAYSQIRVAEAEAGFNRVANDPTATADDRALARRELARLAWLIDGDAGRALAGLAPDRSCDGADLTARILRESGAEERLLAEAESLTARCPAPAQADSIRLWAAGAALALAGTSKTPTDALTRAEALLAATGPDRRTTLTGSRLRLELALARRDPGAALTAWKDYFWLAREDVPQALRRKTPSSEPLFSAALAPGASAEARLGLIDLLVRAGFADEAERYALGTNIGRDGAGHPLWRKARAYFEARNGLEAMILASNRSVARGGDAADLAGAVERARAALMKAAGLSGDPERALLDSYGLYGMVGDTGGYASVHLGHVVQDERRRVEQYGHRSAVAFRLLDNMIANGFESWLWDGRAATGGWAAPGPVIVQVRPEYVSGPADSWELFSRGPARTRIEGKLAKLEAMDAAALRETDVVYLPGLADRLRLQLAEQIGARAKAAAGEGGDLRRAFLDEYWRASFQQNMVFHEGRHALDRTLVRGFARLNDSNLEYRAKLSELALGEFPRFSLLNINEPAIGGGSAHGTANERVLRGYAEWIEANSRAVKGFDPRLPPLAQLDRLSDAQMRAVARSLDPIAP